MMERLLQGIPGVVPYFDDVLVSGHSEAQLLEQLRLALQRFQAKGLRVRRDKCIIGVQEVEFLGYLIDSKGIHPTKSKVKAIHEAPAPQNKAELQAFLGLLNFYSVFLKQKATVAEPLHRLLGKAIPWKWGEEEESAFQNIKKLLSSDSVLMQYHGTLTLFLTCDALPYGVEAVLSHQLPNGSEAPIAFFSKTMSTTERNYSQLDKEALAIVAGIKHFHEYLYGRAFTIVTDHKPLLGLLAGDKQTPTYMSPRMTRWAIFLSDYLYKLIYRPGKSICNADALSRCPIQEPVEDPTPTLGLFHIDDDQLCPVSSTTVAKHTQREKTLRQVMSWILRGWPTGRVGEEFSPFMREQQELSTMQGCLLWGDRVVIPHILQKKTLEALHSGHPGIVRMKALARSYVWWPTLDKDIEKWIVRCDPCQEVRPAPLQAQPTEWEMPSSPWLRIHIDFAGPIDDKFLLIVVDAFSKWLEVIVMPTTTTEATIRALHRLFTTHGLPDVLVSDNGPQLTSKTIEDFLAELGIRHALIAPYRPAGNGQAEKMVRLTKYTLAKMGAGDWQEKIDKFLFAQHITPHTTTKKSPAELLMGRRLRSPLDRLHPQYNPQCQQNNAQLPRTFGIGDPVFALNFQGPRKWLKGLIGRVTGPRSYKVELEDGRTCRHHIDQLWKRWRGVEEDQPDEVGLRHPGEVDFHHPDEVGLHYPDEVGLRHPGEVDFHHPDEVGLHPGEGGLHRPGEVDCHHPNEVGLHHPARQACATPVR
ncbi:zinc finger protein DPF3 isoform X1 [Pantherophis guttatus]|uniref:Gypsy retrotransposon integrase-like protein 1 n=1 Tax=Pantherophis guttatus TaxID=94885 RepID=A0ABM3Z549_PANGU|nr:zinc finger protein DPF3 isoform X1 [Pantherophis guttatus]